MASVTEVVAQEELLMEILLRLPVKPLLRFKCVSKSWLALISTPRFSHLHTLRKYRNTSRPLPSALLLASTPSSHRCPISPLTTSSATQSKSIFRYVKIPGMNITVMQSCNGLLLLEGQPLQGRNHPQNAKHFIYNPTTHKYVALSFPSEEFGTSVLSLFLCFEPLESPYYKVVSIRFKNFSSFSDILAYGMATSFLRVEPEYVINVYSSQTGSWTNRGVCFTAPDHRSAVYSNGAIYWSTCNVSSKYFDVENIAFKTFPMPSGYHGKRYLYFGESGGYLHFIIETEILEYEILELKKDRSKWFVRFHVNLNSMRGKFSHLDFDNAVEHGLLYFFCVLRPEKDEKSIVVFFLDGKVMVYNLVDHSFRELSEFGRRFLRGKSRYDVFHYYENLSWVGSCNAN